jgi:hypothetical protein
VARQVGHDQPSAREVGLHLGEVPGGPAEAVDEQKGWPFPTREVADPGAAPGVVALFQAGQEIGRFRHADGLWFGDCELDGDKAGRVTNPRPRAPKELETEPAGALCAAGFFVA